MELLKKEIKYRASRRGTKELDTYLNPYINQELHQLNEQELTLLCDLLREFETQLQNWFTGVTQPPEKFATLIDHIKSYQK